jgi:DNA repair ATPase RecN
VNDGAEKDITILLGDGPNLVAVTGETGSGKSLLVAKVADLVSGGKATLSSVPSDTDENNTSSALVEMVLRLSEPHLSLVQRSLTAIGLDPKLLFDAETGDSMKTLTLTRELVVAEEKLKSTCAINGHAVSLNGLRTVASPLLAIVDASAAAAALAKQNSRMSIIDTAVPDPIVSYARLTKQEYCSCRGYRQGLEKELSNRMLPVSISDVDDDNDKDIELLQHWVDELDAFEARMTRFCAAVESPAMTAGSNFADAASALWSTSWFDVVSSNDIDDEEAITSALYTNILDFREAVKSLDQQLEAARHARDVLSSLSSAESAITALQRARNHLFDAAGNEHSESAVSLSAEKSHDLLNSVEEALKACTKSLEDETTGLVSLLQSLRQSVSISMEDIDILLADWNTLARKHGMSPFTLPACHQALRAELDGNVEAHRLLPEAITKEKKAREKFEAACSMLTSARQQVAKQLSLAVSQRMPSLGMDGSTFSADLQANTRKCTDLSVYGSNTRLGTDSIDFLLLHGTTNDKLRDTGTSESVNSRERGGKVHVVASSGEKARILLAIECELPGSIGAANRARALCDLETKDSQVRFDHEQSMAPPVSVIYDEIDAHVGGRAAVAMANMLADQSRVRGNSRSKSQVVSITHSPSVAAIADMHILVQRQNSSNGKRGHVPVRATVIDGAQRRKELARTASGDLAPDEAEIFADALLRDGAKRREMAP